MKFLSKESFFRKTFTSRAAFHLYFWAFFFLLFLVLPEKESVPLSTKALTALRTITPALFPVYFHFYIFEKYFYRKRFFAYGVLFIAVLFLYVLSLRAFVLLVFQENANMFGILIFIFFVLLISTSAKVLKRSINERFLLQEIKAKQVQTELDLLKAQINPHFLFNTLNNLFGMARKNQKGTADGIAGLSHLMRYMIYDSEVEKIDLEKEIQQIQRLIELQKLRFSTDDDIDIDFRYEGDIQSFQIPPMLMIPFVENAFKHGISLKAPSFIHINVHIRESTLEFSVKNSLHSRRTDKSKINSGFGLQNVKRRLELLYPDSHELSTETSEDTFEVKLILRQQDSP